MGKDIELNGKHLQSAFSMIQILEVYSKASNNNIGQIMVWHMTSDWRQLLFDVVDLAIKSIFI